MTTFRPIATLFLGLAVLTATCFGSTSDEPTILTSTPNRSSKTVPLAPPPETMLDWWNGPYITGEWGGLRHELESEGITPYTYYNAIVAGNPVGGRQQAGPQYAQDMNFGLTFDMQKLVGWQGATININGIDRAGTTIKHDVGGVYNPMQLVGDQAYYLYNVTLEQKFWNDIGSIKLGRLTAGDDFATSPLYGYYLNNGIDGLIRSLVYNTQFTTYPCATWGARLQFEPNPDWTFKTGVYQVSDQIFNPNYHGVNFGINGSDGISVVQQACWAPEFNKAPAETSSDNDGARSRDTKDIGSAPKLVGMPGHYAIGGYWSNSNYSQFGTPVNTRISYGFYGQASQMIYREAPGSKEGLTVFGAIAYCPQQNISIIPLQLSGGVIYQGLLPDRPKDQTIFGVIHANFSSNYANSVSALGEGSPSNETDLEWGYRVQVTNFAYIQPDVQYIIQPGGTGNIPNAVVLGAQFGLTF